MPKKPIEIVWASEKMGAARAAIAARNYSLAAQHLDVARLHLETIALEQGEALFPRTPVFARMDGEHNKRRVPFPPARTEAAGIAQREDLEKLASAGEPCGKCGAERCECP